MRVSLFESLDAIPRRVPTRALALSAAALAVPVLAALLVPELAGEEYGLLLWLAALVPAFLLTYYRALVGAALAVAAGMAALSLTQLLLVFFNLATPNWGWLLLIVTDFLVITVGIAIFAELLHRERRKAEGLALADQLTRLPNRRLAEMALDREFAAALRGRKLGVVMYDIDHFKRFNDSYGHAAGDDVLRAVGGVLQQYTRRQNISARYGGEEFISVVSDVDQDGILIFANRVREAVKKAELPWGRVSMSGGVAMFREGMGSYEVLVAAADRALYAAKESGRDQIRVADEVMRPPERVSAPRVAAPGRGERVLVVHDEPEERKALVDMLGKQGFRTLDTGSAEEASRILRETTEPFEVLVTSLVMRRTSGFTLVDRLSADAPALRVIYLSDSMRERVSWPGVPGAVHRFVAKPVKPEALLAAMKEALAEEVQVRP